MIPKKWAIRWHVSLHAVLRGDFKYAWKHLRTGYIGSFAHSERLKDLIPIVENAAKIMREGTP